MDDPKWLRFMAIGLVLAAVAVGYFLLSGRLSPGSITRTQASPAPTVLGQENQNVPTPTPSVAPSSTPSSAYNALVDRTRNGTQVLPNTGFPVGPAVIFSVSAIIAGWGLRRFPK